jgi:menaquinone-9 beta-reductase
LAVPISLVVEAAVTINATLRLADAAERAWDVLVIGAGPAGSILARQLAQLGRRVLLVDRASFPRPKVCGCCLSGSTLAALRRIGLGDLPLRLGATPLQSVLLASGSRSATLPLPDGAALSREAFDAALVREAIAAGAAFLPETRASGSSIDAEGRRVECRAASGDRAVQAAIVVAADGLSGRSLVKERAVVRRGSRIGAGAIAAVAPCFFEPGVVYMACGDRGYVGLVRLEDGRLDVAAALDPAEVRRCGGPGQAAALVLARTGWPAIEGLTALSWRGTPPLTRFRRRLGAERLFIAGDAAGYVEPFTGEGIAWALNSAIALAPIVDRAVAVWGPSHLAEWAALHRRLVGRRQRSCAVVARVLRSPFLTWVSIRTLALLPNLARPFVRQLNRPLVGRTFLSAESADAARLNWLASSGDRL